MSTFLRRGLLALTAIVVAVLATVAYLVATFDGERVKTLAVDWVKTEHQRTLTLAGPLRLSLWPRAAVQVEGLSLTEAASNDRFLAVQQAVFSLRVWPLLSGDLVIDKVDLNGVQATLTRDAQGRRNIDDFIGGKGDPAATGSQPQQKSDALRFDISGVTLSDVRLTLKDAVAKVDGTVHVATLTSGRVARGVDTPIELSTRVEFREPAVNGELSGRATVSPDFDSGRLRVNVQALRFKGDVLGAKALQAQIDGQIDWDAGARSGQASALVLALQGSLGGLTVNESTLSLGTLKATMDQPSVTLADLALKVRGQRAQQSLALDLTWPSLSFTEKTVTGSPLQGVLKLGGAQPVQVEFKATGPTGDAERVSVARLDATVSSASAARTLRGDLLAAVQLFPKARQVALSDLQLDARVEQPGLQPVALAASGHLTASPTDAQWKLAGQANDDRFASQGSAKLDRARPYVEMAASFDSLNLDTLLPPAAAPAAPAPPADPKVDLSALNAIDGRFSLSAARLVTQKISVDQLRLQAAIDDGHLTVSTLDGRVWDGRVQGSAQAWSRDSRVAVKAQADGVDVNALLRAVGGKDLLEGRGRVSVDVSSHGAQVSALRSNLAGSSSLALRDGAIKGVNLAKSFRQAKAVLTQREDVAVAASRDEKTDFSALDASFRLREGVARSDDLTMKSPFLRLGGTGEVDIGRSRIDYTVRATVADTSKGQGGADLAALRGLTIPVLVSGPLDAIDWKIQWSAVAAEAAKARVQEKVLEKLGLPQRDGDAQPASPKDALKERLLKGLFR